MADWLKVRHVLVRSPKIRGLMRALRCKRHTALGLALDWLVWIDEQTDDGKTHLLPDELADEIGFRGCAEALIEIGWAALGSDGCVEAVEFGKHCGESAKKRAENALRKARSRMSGEKCHAESVTDVTHNVTQNALPEEKRKEYTNTKVRGRATVDIGAAVPAAPPSPADSADGFGEWLAVMCGCVRAFREARSLHPEVAAEARAAYERFPRAVEYAELLRAYYDDRMAVDRRRKEFWRPQGGQFFRDLEDVVFKHAVRWQREVGLKPVEAKKAAAAKAMPAPEPVADDTEDRRAAWEEAKKETDTEWERYDLEKGGEV